VYARWAAAAAIALGAGWAGGRLSAPAGVSPEQVRAELLPALRQELRQDFETQLASSLRAADNRTDDKLVELAEAWARAREDDKQATLALYQKLDRQQRLDTATLRRDLETVAVVAESAIGDTRDKLTQLAVNSLASPSSSSPLEP
jgi:predicted RNA-binding Zn ribbon-like protein